MARITDRSKVQNPLTNPTGSAIGVGQGDGPGFYQGTVGRKTGRPSPRTPVRAPRHEQVMAAHGLMDQGAADPNQGQLFATPPRPSMRETASANNIAPPLVSSRPGFMPGVYEHQDGGFRNTAEAHKAMVSGIKRMASHELTESGDYASREGQALRPSATHLRAPGTQGPETRAPIANAMHNRQSTADRIRGDAPWYASRTETSPGSGRFDLGPGSATHLVDRMAQRTGESYTMATRVVAQTSPRTAWTIGTPGTGDYSQPNIDSAESVVNAVQTARTRTRSGEINERRALEVGSSAPGKSLGEMKGKAAKLYNTGQTDTKMPIAEVSSQKAPNFEQSLLLGHAHPAVQRQAALSYTVDTHDVTSQGTHVDALKTQAGYAAAQMLGRRTALNNRDLAPMSQSRVWEGQRTKTAAPMGEASMLESTRSGKIRPRQVALPGVSVGKAHTWRDEDF